MAVADSNEDRFVLAGDQDVLFVVDRDGILGEDGNCVVVSCFSDTH